MDIKAALIDFDGTLIRMSVLDYLCGIKGKRQEAHQIGKNFLEGKIDGITCLRERIRFLEGISLEEIHEKLSKLDDFLTPNIESFFDFLKENKIISIINSGNILPVLEYYQDKFGFDYVIGTELETGNGRIKKLLGEKVSDSFSKLEKAKKILKAKNIKPQEVIAIGDSPGDLENFNFSEVSIAINPRGGIEKSTDYIIKTDLLEAVEIMRNLMKRNHLKQ